MVQIMKAIIVIPARLASSRLPNKVLADLGGQPMLWHVYQRCLQVAKAQAVHLATDSEAVSQRVRDWGGQVWMTSPTCTSGTERIVSILEKLQGEVIVNVQGDQPLVEPQLINQVIEKFEENDADIVTPIYPLSEVHSLFDPNVVKVVTNHEGYALYFSRHPIPYVRDVKLENWLQSSPFWGHVGIYGYRRSVLEEYPSLPESPLEKAEKLEQLRFLQAKKKILTLVTSHLPWSVDTAADLEKVRAQLAPP